MLDTFQLICRQRQQGAVTITGNPCPIILTPAQYSLFGNAGTNAFEIKNVHVVQWEAAITGGDHLQKPKTRSTQVGSMIPFGLPRAEWLHRGQSQLVHW